MEGLGENGGGRKKGGTEDSGEGRGRVNASSLRTGGRQEGGNLNAAHDGERRAGHQRRVR
jgi:hypothetical protein